MRRNGSETDHSFPEFMACVPGEGRTEAVQGRWTIRTMAVPFAMRQDKGRTDA
jgi:hypothetical protein